MQKYTKIALILFLFGCESTPYSDLKPELSQEKFTATLLDLHLAESVKNADVVYQFHQFNPQEKKEIFLSVFKKHQTDSASFFKTMEYYQKANPKAFEQILQAVVQQLDSMINQKKSQIPTPKTPLTDSTKLRETISRILNR
jgi:transketolase